MKRKLILLFFCVLLGAARPVRATILPDACGDDKEPRHNKLTNYFNVGMTE